MDLIATHHTNEIAQSMACDHTQPANYWMHTNMLTVNGQRMGKSLGNAFLPAELFAGSHPLLTKGYPPMAVRFFMMQTHYRSTLDFSNQALQASEKGFERLMNTVKLLDKLRPSSKSTVNIGTLRSACYEAMNDDFNSPVLIAQLFEAVRIINAVNDGKESITEEDLNTLKKLIHEFIYDGLGLKDESLAQDSGITDGLMQLILAIRDEAKAKKDFATSDKIRDELNKYKIALKDNKDGTVWTVES
jgi:cysteinyl-tRNA synthetase